MADDMDGWCILRTAAASTLRLASSLTDDGFEAWAPAEAWERRSPRSNKTQRITRALLPSFVFARAVCRQELIALSHSPSMLYQVWDADLRRMVTKGHPYFRVFQPVGARGIVPDGKLNQLRALEQRKKPKAATHVFRPGEQVKLLHGGGLDGMIGVVDRTNGTKVWVTFPDWQAIEMHNWTLLPLDADSRVQVEAA